MSETIVADPQPEKKVGFANKHQYRKTVEDEEKELAALKSQVEEEEQKDEAREELVKEQDDLLETSAEERTFKKRYGDLRRFSQKQKEEFENRVSKLEAQLEETAKTQMQLPKTEDELNAWVQEYPDIAAVIETIAIKKADERSTSVNKKLEEIEKLQVSARKEKAEAELIRLQPDFETIREEDSFHEWVEEQPKWVQTALYDNEDDAYAASRAIDLYKADSGIAAEKSKPKKNSRKEAATSIASKGSKTTPKEGANDTVLRESDVERMSAQEYEAQSETIMEAIRAGSFVYDLSGAAR
jgi:DNA repair exonuclease SbcCD ATPase subunit